ISRLSKQWASLATGRAVASKHSVAIAPIATVDWESRHWGVALIEKPTSQNRISVAAERWRGLPARSDVLSGVGVELRGRTNWRWALHVVDVVPYHLLGLGVPDHHAFLCSR